MWQSALHVTVRGKLKCSCGRQMFLTATSKDCNRMTEALDDGTYLPETEEIYLRLTLEQEILQKVRHLTTLNEALSSKEGNDLQKSIVMDHITTVHDDTDVLAIDSNQGIVLLPKWRQYLTFCLIYLLTSMVVSLTIAFAFLSSSAHPFDIFPSPQETILALNMASNVSVFLIGEVLTSACEILRWTLAANRSTGVGMASLLALGRATGLVGVMSLIISNQGGTGHQKWCGQRYAFRRRDFHLTIG